MVISTQLKQRLLLGCIGIILLVISIYYSYTPLFQPIFVLFNAAIIGGALWEYYQFAKYKGFDPLTGTSIILSVIYVFSIYLAQLHPPLHALPPFVLFVALFLFFFLFFNKQSNPLINLAITVFGIAYLTVPLSFGLKINYFSFHNVHDDGRLWLAYVFAVTKMTDTGAYFFGKTLGKHKFLPHISPKKTREGALGGLLTALITSFIFYIYSLLKTIPFTITFFQTIWFALAIGILAQFGDLAESVLKRDVGVKDSSYLPGLGGLLDIVDSLVFTLPFMYFILKMNFSV